ncbi:hypothetical protein WCU84_02160, partial [Dickeya chrysanthemi]
AGDGHMTSLWRRARSMVSPAGRYVAAATLAASTFSTFPQPLPSASGTGAAVQPVADKGGTRFSFVYLFPPLSPCLAINLFKSIIYFCDVIVMLKMDIQI